MNECIDIITKHMGSSPAKSGSSDKTWISKHLLSQQMWMLLESFVTLVRKTRELDGRAERGNNGGQ